MRECQKKKRDQSKQREQKIQMQQTAEGTMQEEVSSWADMTEAYEMMTGRCKDGDIEELKLIRGECHDTRDLPLLDEGEFVYSGLQQNQSIDSEEKITTFVVSTGKACISTELADLIYDRWKRTKYFE